MPVTSLSPSFWKPSKSSSAESIVADASRPTPLADARESSRVFAGSQTASIDRNNTRVQLPPPYADAGRTLAEIRAASAKA
jgi:hypothetical protein